LSLKINNGFEEKLPRDHCIHIIFFFF